MICRRCDLYSSEDIQRLFNSLSDDGNFPDCILHCARDISNLTPKESMDESIDAFQKELYLGLIVPVILNKMLTERNDNEYRSLINIGSIYGHKVPNLNLYSDPEKQSSIIYGTAKAGLVHLTKELGVRNMDKKVNVYCVSIGGVRGRADRDFEQKYSEIAPNGRMLDNDDFNELIMFLMEVKTNAMSGHTFIVDGGWCL